MNKYTEYLPKNKHDFDRVNQLMNMDPSILVPLLPSLMEWIQDRNWPIADEVAKLLLRFPKEMVPLIKYILSTDDDVWKYWCLEMLVKELPVPCQAHLKSELLRLVERPTAGEKLEQLNETAMEILQTIE